MERSIDYLPPGQREVIATAGNQPLCYRHEVELGGALRSLLPVDLCVGCLRERAANSRRDGRIQVLQEELDRWDADLWETAFRHERALREGDEQSARSLFGASFQDVAIRNRIALQLAAARAPAPGAGDPLDQPITLREALNLIASAQCLADEPHCRSCGAELLPGSSACERTNRGDPQ